jgi:hypothetical protein
VIEVYRPVARCIAWQPLVIAAGVSSLVIATQVGESPALPLQLAAILLAAAVGFSLNDPGYEVLAPSPRSLLRRRLQRATVIVPVMVVAWIAALAATREYLRPVEIGGLSVMFAGLLGLSFGLAGVLGRLSGGRNGSVVATAILVAQFVSSALPPSWRFMPLDGRWSEWSG